MNTQLVPDKTQMRRYLEKGLTQQGIVDQYEADTGIRVARSAIGLAIARYGLESAVPRKRYSELIPWPLMPEHRQHRDVKMLRLESRRRQGLDVSEPELRRLENWLEALNEANAVVLYNPDTEAGFWWTHRLPTDTDIIRQPE